ncbi:MAG: hypothetical protein Q4G22_05900 [Paracoccus sp. (in: a-proteobacteria)]|uniref:hypothetical protein n=1 Tax=Paracoccus sp. TaxID=267 RepID=UPI0026E021E3|nr:hypothetical protein [Paracoccus sp. (in: a-proteobacteria)]MDO5631357.1 hypothetical protein [Paracoccus sp. (in: a-proteobacteria)]
MPVSDITMTWYVYRRPDGTFSDLADMRLPDDQTILKFGGGPISIRSAEPVLVSVVLYRDPGNPQIRSMLPIECGRFLDLEFPPGDIELKLGFCSSAASTNVGILVSFRDDGVVEELDPEVYTNVDRMPDESGMLYEVLKARRLFDLERAALLAEMKEAASPPVIDNDGDGFPDDMDDAPNDPNVANNPPAP